MDSKQQYALLSTQEMARADQLTIRSGISGAVLMAAAGLSVVRHIMGRYDQGKTIVLCGPGNNGGDGFVIARLLKEAGWEVELALLGSVDSLTGDAEIMAHEWQGPILPLTEDIIQGHDIVVDAIFGAGLCRPVTGDVAKVISRINARINARANARTNDNNARVIAVDVPSGIDGNNGQILGVAVRACSTVTFFRQKTGHLLWPATDYCGVLEVADIGILERVLQDINPQTFCNAPIVWQAEFPQPALNSHKYNRGHGVVVSGGAAQGGAARLAAGAALRIGAGLVSVTCPEQAVQSHAAHLTAVMIKPMGAQGDLSALLADSRLKHWCIGPGCGVTAQTKSQTLAIIAADCLSVLDADGLSVFADQPEELFTALKGTTHASILTPHAGEFSRLFPDLMEKGDKLAAAKAAAVRAGAVIIYKGSDTVIASPDGRAVINDNAPSSLATAGSGDVLAGICLGLLAQAMPPFEAACAAVWIHGAAANAFGRGLISTDIAEKIPEVLNFLSEKEN